MKDPSDQPLAIQWPSAQTAHNCPGRAGEAAALGSGSGNGNGNGNTPTAQTALNGYAAASIAQKSPNTAPATTNTAAATTNAAHTGPSRAGAVRPYPITADPVSADLVSADLVSPRRRLRLGVMASGNGSNFEALVQACRSGSLAAEVVLLLVNNPDCLAQARAARLAIPCTLVDHRRFASRQALDAALVAALGAAQVDLVVMAGWMRVVTAHLIAAYPERLVNIHPSLLPSFRGLDGVGQALAAGVTLAGCTAHLVSEQVDAGLILAQAAVPVLASDDRQSLAARILVQEHQILPLAVMLAAQRLGLGIEVQ